MHSSRLSLGGAAALVPGTAASSQTATEAPAAPDTAGSPCTSTASRGRHLAWRTVA
jgi:hypothetical protein